MKRKNILITCGILVSLVLIAAIFITSREPFKAIDSTGGSEPSVNGPIAAAGPDDFADIEVALQQSIAGAMGDFEYNMRFPAYSVPISSNDWDALNPRVFDATPQPIINDEGLATGPEDVKVILSVDKFIADVKRDLPVRVKLVSAQDNDLVDLRQVNVWVNPQSDPFAENNGEVISLHSEWQTSEDDPTTGTWEFSGEVPSRVLRLYGESDVYVVADLTLSDGTRARSRASIKLFESKAEIEQIGEAYVEGPNLIIPVDSFAHVPGEFKLRANLFDETGEVPLTHITETIKTEHAGLVSGTFKVHIATLKEKGDEGPYVLKNINITKTPTRPDYQSGYGAYDDASHAVAGFSFDRYVDEAYVDPEMVRRLAALKKITGQY